MTMTSKAWVYQQRGMPWDVLSLTTRDTPTFPPPTPLPRDAPEPEEWVLVRVAFAGLNPGAIFQMTLVPPLVRSRDCVADLDFTGTVIDVWQPEDKPGRFARGDKVSGMIPASHALPTGTGALAEVIRLPARYVVAKPASVSLGDAACLLPGLTARQLVNESEAKSGDRVLVNAASGGIGTMVVQMVRQVVGENGFIVGVCSGNNAEMVKGLDVDEVIDYTQHTLVARYIAERFSDTPFDAVIDTLGHHSLWLASPAFLKPAGIYESVGIKPPTFYVPDFLRAVWQMQVNAFWPTSRWFGGVGREWRATSMMSPTLEDRQAVIDMLGSGQVRVVRDSVWPFEDAREAYRKLAGQHAAGKVLVKMDPKVGDAEC